MAVEIALLVLVFFLPGLFLVNLLFPERGSLGGELDRLYRGFLGVVMSLSITILYGTLLVIATRGPEEVVFRPELFWTGLFVLTAILFVAGAFRGAYPWLVRRPRPLTVEPSEGGARGFELIDRLTEVTTSLEETRRILRAPGMVEGERGRLEGLVKELEAEKRRLEEEAEDPW